MWLVFFFIAVFTFFSPGLVPPHHWLRWYLCYFVYAAYGTFLPFFLIPLHLFGINVYSRALMAIILMSSKNMGIKWDKRNKEAIEKHKCAIIVVNHQSILDVIGVIIMNGGLASLVGVGKKELNYNVPLSIFLRILGYVFIDRKKPKEAMELMSKLLIKKDKKVFIFPEGTRNQNGNGILPFKKGAFKLAIQYKVPIVPLVIAPLYFIKRMKEFSDGTFILSCLNPIETKDLKEEDTEALMNKTRDLMEREYFKLKDELTVSNNNVQKD